MIPGIRVEISSTGCIDCSTRFLGIWLQSHDVIRQVLSTYCRSNHTSTWTAVCVMLEALCYTWLREQRATHRQACCDHAGLPASFSVDERCLPRKSGRWQKAHNKKWIATIKHSGRCYLLIHAKAQTVFSRWRIPNYVLGHQMSRASW